MRGFDPISGADYLANKDAGGNRSALQRGPQTHPRERRGDGDEALSSISRAPAHPLRGFEIGQDSAAPDSARPTRAFGKEKRVRTIIVSPAKIGDP